MSQITCKCGELLSVEPGATAVTCPACNANYRVRAVTTAAPLSALPTAVPAPLPVGQTFLSAGQAGMPAPPPLPAMPPPMPAAASAPSRRHSGGTSRLPSDDVAASTPSRRHSGGTSRLPSDDIAASAQPVSRRHSGGTSRLPNDDVAATVPAQMPGRRHSGGQAQPPPPPPPLLPEENIESDETMVAADLNGDFETEPESTPETAQPSRRIGGLPTAATAATPHRTKTGTVDRTKAAAASGARRSGVARLDDPEHVRTPSKAPLIVAIFGGIAALAGIAMLVVGVPGRKESGKPAVSQLKEDLQQRLAASKAAYAAELRKQELVRTDLDAIKKKTGELRLEDEMVDSRFTASINGSGIKVLEAELASLRSAIKETIAVANIPTKAADPVTVIARSEKSVVVILTDHGSGSGFVLNSEGLCATNYHVIEASTSLTVKIQMKGSRDQVELPGAKIVAANQGQDLALIQLPAAPDTVSNDGTYPAVYLRPGAVVIGESVIAIGNPGFQSRLLTYTSTTGIVSNHTDMIQTTAAVNPGNSGGPLFDASGLVLGVVSSKISAKGGEVESVAFAIPAAVLKHFIESRTDEAYNVKGSLQDWEQVHNPSQSIGVASKEYREKEGITLPDAYNEMVLSSDGKMLYLLATKSGVIQEFLLDTNKPGRKFEAHMGMESMTVLASGNILAVAGYKKKLLLIDTKKMALEKEASLRTRAISITTLGGPNDYAILANVFGGQIGESALVGRDELGRDGPAGVELPKSMTTYHSASSAKWVAFLTYNADTEDYALRTYPFDKCMKEFADWSSFRQQNAKLTEAEVKDKLNGFSEKLLAFERKYVVPTRMEDDAVGDIFFTEPDRLIMGRRGYKLGEKLEPDVLFSPNPILAKEPDMPDAQRRLYEHADVIHAASFNGKFAASRAHVYDAKTGKIMKKFPFIISEPVFSKDGKTIYAFDSSHHFLFRFVDWEKSLK